MWHLETATRLGDPFPSDADFVATGAGTTGLVTAVGDHLLVWNLDVHTWPDIACQAAGRNLTLEEWEQLSPADEPYRATCPQWSSAEDLS